LIIHPPPDPLPSEERDYFDFLRMHQRMNQKILSSGSGRLIPVILQIFSYEIGRGIQGGQNSIRDRCGLGRGLLEVWNHYCGHMGCLCCQNSCIGVLEHDAKLGINRQPPAGFQENIWRRLAPGNLITRYNARKPSIQASVKKGTPSNNSIRIERAGRESRDYAKTDRFGVPISCLFTHQVHKFIESDHENTR
jgi:hypothetical protein